MKRFNLFLVCYALLTLIPFYSSAQSNRQYDFESKKTFEEIVSDFKKNIVIDKEDYDIRINYCDNDSQSVIFSGVAKELGGLISESFDIVDSKLSFKIELKINSEGKFVLEVIDMIYHFSASNGGFSHLTLDILKVIEDELDIIAFNNNKFEIDKYFYNTVERKFEELEAQKVIANNESLKKKERKYALYKCQDLENKYKVYSTIAKNAEQLITRLKVYYLY